MPDTPPGTNRIDLSGLAARISGAWQALTSPAHPVTRQASTPPPNPPTIPATGPGVPAPTPNTEQVPTLGVRDFNPLPPLKPRVSPFDIEQRTGPRVFQYPVGSNIITSPRREFPALAPFDQLRNLASMYDVAALCIATRIEELQGMAHGVVAKDKRENRYLRDEIDEVEKFWKKPDGLTNFNAWLSMLIRDHLEVDAATIYKHIDRGGKLYGLDLVDGTTIKPVIDDRGRALAYQQVLYGFPFSEYRHPDADRVDEQLSVFGNEIDGLADWPIYTNQEIMYLPRFTSTRSPYGSPPTEWIIMRVNQAIRKQISDLSYFTDGNIPDMMASISDPNGQLTPEQVDEFEKWFNAVLVGNDAERRRLRFIPYATQIQEMRPFSYETTLDQWMLQIACAAYSVPPQELGFTQDVNRSTAELQEAVNERKGLKPLATWLKDSVFDPITHDHLVPERCGSKTISLRGAPTRKPINPFAMLEWTWYFGDKIDASTTASTYEAYVSMGVLSPDEVRAMQFSDQVEGPSPATKEKEAAAAESAAPPAGPTASGPARPGPSAGSGRGLPAPALEEEAIPEEGLAEEGVPEEEIAVAAMAGGLRKFQRRPLTGETCFACDKPITDMAYEVFTADPQMQYVGRECYRKIKAAGENGYQPKLGGPRLYIAPPARAAKSIAAPSSLTDQAEADLRKAYRMAARKLLAALQLAVAAGDHPLRIPAWEDFTDDLTLALADGLGQVTAASFNRISRRLGNDLSKASRPEKLGTQLQKWAGELADFEARRIVEALQSYTKGTYRGYIRKGDVAMFMRSMRDWFLQSDIVDASAVTRAYNYPIVRAVEAANGRATIRKTAASEAFGKVAMWPPLHKNCRCKLRARKIGDVWYTIWHTEFTDPCVRKIKTPLGAKDGCAALKGLCVLTGPKLGQRL